MPGTYLTSMGSSYKTLISLHFLKHLLPTDSLVQNPFPHEKSLTFLEEVLKVEASTIQQDDHRIKEWLELKGT